MKAKVIEVSELPRLHALAERQGTLFERQAWTENVAGLQTVGIYEDGGELIGGLHVHVRRRFGLSTCTNAPFSPSCGPFLSVKAKHPVAVLETWREAMEAVVSWLTRERHAVVLLRFARSLTDFVPFWHAGYHVTPAYTYVLDAQQSDEEILANMASARRRNIQKAERDGLVVRPVTQFELVKELVLGTFARQRERVDPLALERILFTFADPDNSYAFACWQGSTPLSCCFVVHDQRTAYYLMGGYAEQSKHPGAGALAMWTAIRHARTLGLEWFDFEGSMIPAIERYFRGFGGKLTHYFTVTRAWLPVEIALKWKRRSLF